MKLEFQSPLDTAKFIQVMAADAINEMILIPEFWDGIPDNKLFDYATIPSNEIKAIMHVWLKKTKLVIGFYRSTWFFRGVVAHVKPKNPTLVNFNTRHHDFCLLKGETVKEDISEKINTTAHELVHTIDNLYENAEFGHGNENDPFLTKGSFPVWFGKYCQEFFLNSEFFNSKTLKILKKAY